MMGRVPRQDEGDALSLRNRELGDGGQVLSPQLDRCDKPQHVGPGDRPDAMFDALDPGNDRSVVESDDQLHAHGHRPASALDDPYDIRCLAARRHEVDDGDGSAVDFEVSFEDKSVAAVMSSYRPHLTGGGDLP